MIFPEHNSEYKLYTCKKYIQLCKVYSLKPKISSDTHLLFDLV